MRRTRGATRDDDGEKGGGQSSRRKRSSGPRGIGGWIWVAFLMVIPLYFLFSFGSDAKTHREWVRLTEAGGGEIRYIAADVSCSPRPHPIASKPMWIAWRARVEVVARERGWGLIGLRGEPCWVPEWALRDAAPENARASRFCGPDCEVRAPPGWYEAQAREACTYSAADRFSCFLGMQRSAG